jgi:two-component system chemotaxis sensor kinase CheA
MTYTINITSEMKRQFQSEAAEHLNHLEKMLIAIEKDHRNQEAVHSAFRSIHSIKGNSAYLDAKDIHALSHELENLMDDLRSGKVAFESEALAVLFEGLDLLRDMNRRIIDNDYKERDISAIRERIGSVRASSEHETADQKPLTSDSKSFSEILEQEIKVGLEKIDEFMTHISELVIAKNRLNYLTQKNMLSSQTAECFGEIRKVSANMDKIANQLQRDVMKLRLVKISTLFERLPRLVRDLAAQREKEIKLHLSGGETEIERKTAEQLMDPFIHLIRNAVDHGIEKPDERTAKGKPRAGSVTVSAHQDGNHAIIDIIDDGRGFDIGGIRQIAAEKNLLTKAALAAMTDAEILDLTFRPGFSTLNSATEISGRGVGLDVVKSNIKSVGGSVTLSGKPGFGAQVRLKMPISISLTDVLLTEAAGTRYAFPFTSIKKTVKVQRKFIHVLRNKEIILVDGDIFPMRYLGEILEINGSEKFRHRDSEEFVSVILGSFGNRICGIAVDEILKRESILIRPLEKYFAGTKEISGSTLLGDGSIALVIDPKEIIL